MTKTKSQTLNELFKEYNLVYDPDNKKDSDIFISKNFKIITRSGVEKIQAATGIVGTFKLETSDPFSVIIKGTFVDQRGNSVETFGEASVDRVTPIVVTHEAETTRPDGTKVVKRVQEVQNITTLKGNVQQNPAYLVAMAEKRAMSRAVLKLAGLYEQGIYSEDEADEFAKEVRRQRS